jgi:hypothetical protein
VFTEQGVAMLSSVLNSERAVQVNIQIIRIFTKLRLAIKDNTEIRLEIAKIKSALHDQGKNMEIVFSYLDERSQVQTEPESVLCQMPFKAILISILLLLGTTAIRLKHQLNTPFQFDNCLRQTTSVKQTMILL